MSSQRSLKWPELSLRITRQGKPQGPNDSRYDVTDLLERDAADIAAGKALLIEVQLLRKHNAKAIPQEVETLFNRVGPPSAVGTYSHPEQIVDPELRRDATDMWAVEFAIEVGDLVRWRGREYQVEELEDVDRGYGEFGYRTGYALCRRTDSPPGSQCNPKRLRVDMLTPADKGAANPSRTGQSVSKRGPRR
ncbi:hypothetical protein [Streptomyces sp. NBC_00439]|uniref:hypothetical protein n=1 Tax=Streptomyces sp. NBC_00439 TaxID=2903650 RepID=UPI002253EF2E|nr:hypothetical protein [Streptomyces sp. NBC_00439]MCX5103483.1 hypothetical protein [Streptomyces sp. NBC_00439]